MLPDAFLLNGTPSLPSPLIPLTSGPLSLLFDPATGALRQIRLGNVEILRGIYGAVRDRNWGTVTPTLSDLHIEEENGGFALRFSAACREREIDFRWDGHISGRSDGSLSYAMAGVSHSTFLRNRIGLCVLHPIQECAGRPCIIEHTEGTWTEGVFPSLISPNQPFLAIRVITHMVLPNVRAEVRFDGDTFEMEDQRNWTDASFKIYSTPIDEPYPVEIPAGTEINQTVTLTLSETPSHSLEPTSTPVTPLVLQLAAPPLPLPGIGLGMAFHGGELTPREIKRLRVLHPAHLRVDLKLWETGWQTRLQQAARQAADLSAGLECALFLSSDAETELPAFAKEISHVESTVTRCLLFHRDEKSTGERWLALARAPLSGFPLFGGTNANFAEINRNRPAVERIDGVCCSINPQVHTFDDLSLVENLAAQAETVRSARAFAPGKEIAVSPVTFRPRFNPDATGDLPDIPGGLPSSVDPRQMSLFGAGWTLGSLKYLSESSASSITYYETTGWRGVMETEAGSPLPSLFPSLPGTVFPLYHVLADIGEFAGGQILQTASSAPLQVAALTLQKENRRRLLCANLTGDSQTVRLEIFARTNLYRSRFLDAARAEQAMHEPERFRAADGLALQAANNILELELPAYAYACVDAENGEAKTDE